MGRSALLAIFEIVVNASARWQRHSTVQGGAAAKGIEIKAPDAVKLNVGLPA
jgi:hypothetical protein